MSCYSWYTFIVPPLCMDWDSQFPFSKDEVSLFASLQSKATKFPFPKDLKERENLEAKHSDLQPPKFYLSAEDIEFQNITAEYEHVKEQFQHTQNILRQLDLLLEAHRQLCLLTTVQSEPASPSPSPSIAKSELLSKLSAVQERIAALEERQKAEVFIQSAVLPSLTASPAFFDALQCLHRTGAISRPVHEKVQLLMKRCWSNTLTAMERVLDADLDSIEAYMDDHSYNEFKEKMLQPLIRIIALDPPAYAECLLDFTAQYAQLRQNSLRFFLDSDFILSTAPPAEQIEHLIERARLLMQVEAREFDGLFGKLVQKSQARNEILETVGNLIYTRLEQLAKEAPDTTQVALLIQSLLESLLLLQSNTNDPFALFLQLLQRNLFPLPATTDPSLSDQILEV